MKEQKKITMNEFSVKPFFRLRSSSAAKAGKLSDLILRSYRNYSDYCFTPSSRSFCFAKAKSSLTISALLRDSAKLRPTQNPPHSSAITRCPYLCVKFKFMRHPELVSGSFQITHYTIIENNYGQLRQMDAHRCSIKFL